MSCVWHIIICYTVFILSYMVTDTFNNDYAELEQRAARSIRDLKKRVVLLRQKFERAKKKRTLTRIRKSLSSL